MHGAPQAERARVWLLGPRREPETLRSPRFPGKNLRGGEMGAGVRAVAGAKGMGLSRDPFEPLTGCRVPA